MAWPNVNTGNVNIAGTTTIRWGTGHAWAPSTSAVVLSADSAKDVEKIYLEQGDGMRATRVLINQGQTWDFTVQDDSGIAWPNVAEQVIVVSFLGGTSNYAYKGCVVDNNYRAARKQEGQRVIRIENMTLIDTTSAS